MYGLTFDMNDLFTRLYSVALKGDPDCGGMISYNYFSGELVTGFDAGAPLFVRDAESKFYTGKYHENASVFCTCSFKNPVWI